MNKKSYLHSFAIFNCVPPRKEGTDPIIYWYHGESDEVNQKYYKLNQIGLIITFISFCLRFDTNLPCDYVFTNEHEISMLELSGAIWMAVVLKSKEARNRSLLHSILQHCRMMFSTFFVPLPKLQEKMERFDIDNKILEYLDVAFPTIVNSIDWNRLDFRYLFNSFIMQPLKYEENRLEDVCKQFLSFNHDIIDDIAILYHHNRIVYSSFDPTVTRILSFAMRRKFTHIFLHNPARETDILTWLVGLYINNAGLNSIYQPPVFYNGKRHLLLAFLDGNYKIVLTQPSDIIITEELLQSIPKRLWQVRQFLKNSPTISPLTEIPLPFATTKNLYKVQTITFENHNLDAAMTARVDPNFIQVHDVATAYSRNAIIAYPEKSSLFVKCEIDDDTKEERIIIAQPTPGGVSHCLKICSFILQPRKAPSKNGFCLIS
ncbi:hypothetical protein TRFO_22062 [Tritrichomonas foetus]|uniref:CCZ1/INTU/HSP4 first Longin domain-containing protein n=1 Tax=Tritrichomonas foetus TaxID=1144522 RepID=A0A1J4KDS9_9EUKA|nr:hypothetical protein TRFO_22062 [Tritrichomonas foetus]|eukprot:OHT09146.1 hypothetical protein TRFO_22062 [Tritrichomonas foetus]